MGLIPSCSKSAVDPGMRLWTFVSSDLLLLMELVLLLIRKDRLLCFFSQRTHVYWGSYRSREGDSSSLCIFTVTSHDATVPWLNLESNVLLGPAHIAFLKFCCRTDFHLPSPFIFFLLRSPYTTGTEVWLQQGRGWRHGTSWVQRWPCLQGSAWSKGRIASGRLAVRGTAVSCSCFWHASIQQLYMMGKVAEKTRSWAVSA